MQIEVNNKTIVTILTIIVAGGLVFAGYKIINENISREGSETRRNLAEKADKKDIDNLSAKLEASIAQLSTKMDEMNKQMTAAPTTNSTTTPTPTTTTDSVSAEEELLTELGNDIEDMKDIQEDAVNALNDINDTIEDLTDAIGDIAANTGSMASDLSALVGMAEQAQIKAQTLSQQAEQAISQYGEKLVANQNVLTARQELFNATLSGNAQTIAGAESKLISTLNTSGSNITPAFAEQYFKQIPTSFGKINGMDSALNGVKIQGFKFDFSKMNFSKPSIDRSINDSRSLNTTIGR